MKITCTQLDLNEALATVSHALSAKSAMPVLSYVKLSYEGSTLTLMCSDLSLTISCGIPAQIESSGSVLLPGQLLTEFIRKLPDQDVELSVSQHLQVKITSGEARITLQGLSTDNYPYLQDAVSADFSATLDQSTLKDMIRQTSFAVASEDTMRAILTGILVEVTGGVMTMVALDSFRMALRRANLLSGSGDFSFVVPGKYLIALSRLLPEATDEITLGFTSSHMLVTKGQTRLTARLLDGEFINYRQIIPSEHTLQTMIGRGALLSCMDRASLFARKGDSHVKMQITEDTLIVTSYDERGDLYEAIPIQTQGKDMQIAFNVRYISDVVKNLSDEAIIMRFQSPVSSCTVVPETGDSFLYLLLPVRV